MTIVFIIIAAIFKAGMDTLQFHYHKSIFKNWYVMFWNPNHSWENKYIKGTLTPKFFGSTTFLVWTTDGWHLFQMIFLNSFLLAIIFYHTILNVWIDFIIFATLFKIIFELFYKFILIKKEKK